jgi:hypothetical protein
LSNIDGFGKGQRGINQGEELEKEKDWVLQKTTFFEE